MLQPRVSLSWTATTEILLNITWKQTYQKQSAIEHKMLQRYTVSKLLLYT